MGAYARRGKAQRLCVGVALALATSISGCGTEAVPNEPVGGGTSATELHFTHVGTLELAPGQTVEVELDGDPGTSVRLLLLGTTLDASLTPAEVVLGDDGKAIATLTAPTTAATFVLRAQSDEGSAELPVAVSQQGFFSLRVVPQYDGSRELTESWSADVLVGGDCSALLATYPEAPIGSLSDSAALDSIPLISSVPVGPVLAVGLRNGKLVAGCTVMSATSAVEEQEVVVELKDRSIVLPGARLSLSLEFGVEPASFGQIVQSGGKVIADTAFPPEATTTTIVATEMLTQLSPDAAVSLQELLANPDFVLAVETATGPFDANEYCASMATNSAALAEAAVADGAANVVGTIEGLSDVPEGASFKLEALLGLPLYALPQRSLPFVWVDTGNDSLLITGSVPLSATRLAGAYMSNQVAQELGDEFSPADAIRGQLNCNAFGLAINDAGPVAECDAPCLEQACILAVASRWELGLASDEVEGSGLSSLSVAASGAVTVNDELAPAALLGTWSGLLSALGKEADAQGVATGSPAPPR
jgi:hypothetical protein